MNKNYLVSTLVYNNQFKGIKESNLKSSNITMIEFTRDIISNIQDYELLKNSGIYFLFLDNNEIYVDQSVNIFERIQTHNYQDKKDFYKIIAFITNDNQFSKTFIDYSEWYFINKIKDQQSFYKLFNDKKRELEPKLNSHDKCEVELINDGIEQLLLFANINFDQKINYKKDVFYLNNAKLIFQNGQFILLKGSIIPVPEKMVNDKDDQKYNSYLSFIEENKDSLIKVNNQYNLTNDLLTSSCSFATALVKNTISCKYE